MIQQRRDQKLGSVGKVACHAIMRTWVQIPRIHTKPDNIACVYSSIAAIELESRDRQIPRNYQHLLLHISNKMESSHVHWRSSSDLRTHTVPPEHTWMKMHAHLHTSYKGILHSMYICMYGYNIYTQIQFCSGFVETGPTLWPGLELRLTMYTRLALNSC